LIGRVVRRGDSVRNLLYYLFGPGKANEHVNPHLVAGWGDPVALEPPVRASGRRDFHRLTKLLELPVKLDRARGRVIDIRFHGSRFPIRGTRFSGSMPLRLMVCQIPGYFIFIHNLTPLQPQVKFKPACHARSTCRQLFQCRHQERIFSHKPSKSSQVMK
jgi:hypothetical protein